MKTKRDRARNFTFRQNQKIRSLMESAEQAKQE